MLDKKSKGDYSIVVRKVFSICISFPLFAHPEGEIE